MRTREAHCADRHALQALTAATFMAPPLMIEVLSLMPLFERFLSVWVLLCILAGITLGTLAPGLFQALAALEYGSVNFVVAILIWFMVYPMMVAVDFTSLKRIHERPKGLIITLVVNWLISTRSPPLVTLQAGWRGAADLCGRGPGGR
jgi:ACR3 family arsenite efflux pump ArsB